MSAFGQVYPLCPQWRLAVEKAMLLYNRVIDSIIKILDELIAFFVAAVIAITILSVFMRYVVNKPFAWSEEICLMGFAWFTFMGAGSAIRKRSVVSLDFFYELMSLKWKKIVKIFTTIICVLAYGFIIHYGFKILNIVKTTYTAALKIPYTFLYIVIPVGGIFSMMALVANLFDVLMNQDKDESEFSEEAISKRERLEAEEPGII